MTSDLWGLTVASALPHPGPLTTRPERPSSCLLAFVLGSFLSVLTQELLKWESNHATRLLQTPNKQGREWQVRGQVARAGDWMKNGHIFIF